MSHYAPVVPTEVAAWLQDDIDYLGSYHLILAHDVLDKPGEYNQIYNNGVRKLYKDSFIIMDNSVVELGSAMGMKDLLEACKIVKPDCLVMPDVMGDGFATRELAADFCKEFAGAAVGNPDFDHIILMGVVQGVSLEECYHTASLYYTLPLVRHIGVPRVLTKQFGTRAQVVHKMISAPLFDRIHLLGFSDNLLDDVACARMPGVAGIDSAVPVRAGLADIMLTIEEERDYGPRGDFWDTLMEMCDAHDHSITTNISMFRYWIGDTAR